LLQAERSPTASLDFRLIFEHLFLRPIDFDAVFDRSGVAQVNDVELSSEAIVSKVLIRTE
jgi:hypothetical protein